MAFDPFKGELVTMRCFVAALEGDYPVPKVTIFAALCGRMGRESVPFVDDAFIVRVYDKVSRPAGT